ncbi:MAG: DEAD/DEAH box helicase family protein [Verrucomicrobiales bacterium]
MPIAVVEAKPDYKLPGDGMSQAKEYAKLLKLKFAYSTNGKGIVEFNALTGKEKVIDTFPTPEELWSRLQGGDPLPAEKQETLLSPYFKDPERPPRYYQQIAINRAVEAVLRGDKRILITMATGTGKTVVAFQLCYKLWKSGWNLEDDPVKKPKILFLADRNILIDDPKDKTFIPFGDARHKIENGEVVKSREMYFAIYQAIAEDENRPGLFKEYDPDFFDLVIIDECHRGSAKGGGNWRKILDHFGPAVQIGMTATPLRKDNKATYRYFGNPIYQYSLRQGLDDGFLAPYRVHRVVTSDDAAGWRPTSGERDKLGREIPDEEYHTADFERKLSLRPRSEAIAKHLTDFLKNTNEYDKTIVFCVDQEHADEMRQLLNNLNPEMVKKHSDYVCRVTSDEGSIGKGHLSRFQELETETPVILTTSQLLSTGVDAPMVKNVVLIRMVGTMTEFKQIIGRGTRLREDYGKFYFNILDYTGTATAHFADPKFDGDPEGISEEEIDDQGNITGTEVIDPGGSEDDDDDDHDDPDDDQEDDDFTYPPTIIEPPIAQEPRKYYVENGRSSIATHLTQDLSADGRQLRVSEFRDYTGEVVRSLFADVAEFRHGWSNPETRNEILEQLVEKGIVSDEVGEIFDTPDADPFDILCNLAWNAPVVSRTERAKRLRKEEAEFFDTYSDSAKEILDALLTKYAEHGPGEFAIPDTLKIPPISALGNVSEIVEEFGGVDELKEAVSQLQQLIYAA